MVINSGSCASDSRPSAIRYGHQRKMCKVPEKLSDLMDVRGLR